MKKKAVKNKKSKKQTLMDKLPNNRGELLEIMIRLTNKPAIKSGPGSTMAKQLLRLKEELSQWRKEN